jgi:hypothetical protein
MNTNQLEKNSTTINVESEALQNPLNWWDKTHEKASTLARWISLYEAVNLIADKAEEKNIKLDEVQFKPLDIYDYMSATENINLKRILKELYKIQICYSEDASDEFKDFVESLPVES